MVSIVFDSPEPNRRGIPEITVPEQFFLGRPRLGFSGAESSATTMGRLCVSGGSAAATGDECVEVEEKLEDCDNAIGMAAVERL